MGHEDVRTTFNIYGHLFDDDEDALVRRLGRRARDAASRALARSLLRASDVGDLLGVGDAEVIELLSQTPEKAL